MSISARLTGIAALSFALLLPLFGVLLSQAFYASTQTGFDRRIEAYLLFLAGRLDAAPDGEPTLSSEPGDDRFEQLFSGWYWQLDFDGRVIDTSRSLWDQSLAVGELPIGEAVELSGPRGQRLRGALMHLDLARVQGPVTLLVAGPQQEVAAEVASFNRLLVRSLGSLGLILLVVLILQLRWGLAPLRAMTDGLKRVREGSTGRLDEDLPADLRALARALNELLDHQQQLVERGRSVAGNLAHALKTPLAVLRLEAARQPQADALRSALIQVEHTVDHHLARAAAAGRSATARHRTVLAAALAPVIDAVRQMHRSRPVTLASSLAASHEVPVDAQDLQELVGNLLDNAMKWASSGVRLEARDEGGCCILTVDDDGPGIDAARRDQVLSRGQRLDERSPGSGLGLDIVRDLATLYGLDIGLGQSAAGGLRVTLRFPPVGTPAKKGWGGWARLRRAIGRRRWPGSARRPDIVGTD